MDWAKQTEEMMNAWTETQKKMWDNWLETVQQGADQSQAAEIWQKTVDTWEKTVKNSLDAQAEWTKAWAESLGTKVDVPEEMTAWANQAQEMAKRWGDTQQQLWQGWFDLVKKADPAKMAEAWGEEGQKAFQTWQESARKVMDAQMKWTSTWASEQDEDENLDRKT
jgi:hypothetical protein